MLYEDNDGNLLLPDEVDELSPFEIEEKGIHLMEYSEYWCLKECDSGNKQHDDKEYYDYVNHKIKLENSV